MLQRPKKAVRKDESGTGNEGQAIIHLENCYTQNIFSP